MKKDDFSCLGDSKTHACKKKIAHFKGSERFWYMALRAVMATKSQ